MNKDYHCRSRPKYDSDRHFDPHFEEVRGGVEPWSMARWKALAEFFLSVIRLLFLSHFLSHFFSISHFAIQRCKRAVVLTQYRRVTDGRTDGRTHDDS